MGHFEYFEVVKGEAWTFKNTKFSVLDFLSTSI